MNHQDAHKLLDMAKDGQPVPEDVLTEALFLTGDAACWRDIPCQDVDEFVRVMREAGQL